MDSISFIVDAEGNVAQIKLLNPQSTHHKLAEEAIRVIRERPRWIPATQNDKKVISRKIQPISWQVSTE